MVKYNFAIAGHKDRGREVIQILESFGGVNKDKKLGNNTMGYYYISSIDDSICITYVRSAFTYLFTLEYFKKTYPYKKDDPVYLKGMGRETLCSVETLTFKSGDVKYTVKEIGTPNLYTVTVNQLKEAKMGMKNFLKPGYVVEYDDGTRCVLTQDVHGTIFGIQIGNTSMWAGPHPTWEGVAAVYQINEPGNLHNKDKWEDRLTKVWEREPEVVEVTMDEIAKKFGCNVEQLKIKK